MAHEPITVDRKTGPALYTPRGHLSIAVACQPKVAEAMCAVDGFRDRGGAARILPAFPSSNVGDRSITAHKLVIITKLEGVGARCRPLTQANLTPIERAEAEELTRKLADTGGLGQFVICLAGTWHDLDARDRLAACHAWQLPAAHAPLEDAA